MNPLSYHLRKLAENIRHMEQAVEEAQAGNWAHAADRIQKAREDARNARLELEAVLQHLGEKGIAA